MTDPFIWIALAGGVLLGIVTMWSLSRPRAGFWRCARCTAVFEAFEGGRCPACNFKRHKYLGKNRP